MPLSCYVTQISHHVHLEVRLARLARQARLEGQGGDRKIGEGKNKREKDKIFQRLSWMFLSM